MANENNYQFFKGFMEFAEKDARFRKTFGNTISPDTKKGNNCLNLSDSFMDKKKEPSIVVLNVTGKDAKVFIYTNENKRAEQKALFERNADAVREVAPGIGIGEKDTRFFEASFTKMTGKEFKLGENNSDAYQWMLDTAYHLKRVIEICS